MQFKYFVYEDAETYSKAVLTGPNSVGAANYLEDPSTGAHCYGFLVEGGKVEQFEPYILRPGDDRNAFKTELNLLQRLAFDPRACFVAHNAAFETRFWKRFMEPLGLPPIPIERRKCTMAKVAAHALPLGLEDAANALQLHHRKLDSSAMEALSKYRKDGRPWRYSDDPDKFEQMYTYCQKDILVCREIDETLDDLTEYEQLIWQIDWQINDYGVQFDVPLVDKTCKFIEQDKSFNVEKFNAQVASFRPTQRKLFKKFLADLGYPVKNTKRPTLEALCKTAPDHICDAIDLFIGSNKTSLSKFPAILRKIDGRGIARETKQYSAAHTRRWGGRGIQLDNLLRPKYSIPHLATNVTDCDFETFCWLYDYDTSVALSSMIRGTIIARPEMELLVGDYAQMEHRITVWLAEQEDALEAARNGEDPYILQAIKVFNRLLTKEDNDERQVGKINVLAFGYQGGIGACNKFADDAGVDLDALFHSFYVPFATAEERENAEYSYILHVKRVETHNAKSTDAEKVNPGTKEGCLAADLLKQRWRKANSNVVKYWARVEYAAIEAVLHPGRVYKVGDQCFEMPNGTLLKEQHGIPEVSFFMHKEFLICKLPSGGHICYPYPRVDITKRGKRTLTYMFVDKEHGKRWIRTSTYGGKLTENIVQATQRDLLTDAMIRVVRAGMQIVLHVHDELVVEVDIDSGKILEFTDLMSKRNKRWNADIPVNVESFVTRRYRKG